MDRRPFSCPNCSRPVELLLKREFEGLIWKSCEACEKAFEAGRKSVIGEISPDDDEGPGYTLRHARRKP